MPSAKEPTEFEVTAGQHSFDTANSQQTLSSFFKSSGSIDLARLVARTDDDDPDDLDALDESGGLGVAPKKAEHDDVFSSVLHQRPGLSQDRLLEQLIGTKAAKAKKKELAGSARTPDSKPSKTAAAKHITQKEPDDSEDEGGRASAFSSRRQAGAITHAKRDHAKSKDEQQPNSNSSSARTVLAPRHEARAASDSGSDTQVTSKSAKRKAAGGYLDELLASKTRKKKKKGGECPV